MMPQISRTIKKRHTQWATAAAEANHTQCLAHKRNTLGLLAAISQYILSVLCCDDMCQESICAKKRQRTLATNSTQHMVDPTSVFDAQLHSEPHITVGVLSMRISTLSRWAAHTTRSACTCTQAGHTCRLPGLGLGLWHRV